MRGLCGRCHPPEEDMGRCLPPPCHSDLFGWFFHGFRRWPLSQMKPVVWGEGSLVILAPACSLGERGVGGRKHCPHILTPAPSSLLSSAFYSPSYYLPVRGGFSQN